MLDARFLNGLINWKNKLSVLLLGSIGFHLFGLMRYPAPTCDETFYARTALTYGGAFRTGSVWPPLTSTTLVTHGRIYWFLLYQALNLMGENLIASRSLSFLGTVLLILATYWLGKLYTSPRIAKWAANLVGFTWLVVFSGHIGRPDVLLAAAVTGTLGLLKLATKNNTPMRYFLLGSALCLQIDIHMNALHFVAPVLFIAAIEIFKKRAWVQGLYLLSGLSLGGSFVLISHNVFWLKLSTTPTNPVQILTYFTNFTGNNLLAVSGYSLITFWQKYYLGLVPLFSIPQVVLFLIGLVWTPFADKEDLTHLWLVAWLSMFSFAVINQSYQLSGYALLWLPLYFILGIKAVENLLLKFKLAQYLPYVLSIFIALNILGSLYLIRTNYTQAYYQTTQQILRQIPAGKKLMAHEIWWFAAHNQVEFIDEAFLHPSKPDMWWDGFNEYTESQATLLRQTPNPDQTLLVETGWQALAPDYVIEDGQIGCFSGSSPILDFLSQKLEQQCLPVNKFQFVEFANLSPLGNLQTIYKCSQN